MSDLETDERLSAELKGAGWSLQPPPGAKDRILERVAHRRRTFDVWLAAGATAVVVTSAVLVWPALTGQIATGPTPPANQITTSPPTNPPRSVLPPHDVIQRLRQVVWFVSTTNKTPALTRQEAVTRARAATASDSRRYPTATAWLVKGSFNPDGFPWLTRKVNPGWLIQLHQPLADPTHGTPPSFADRLVLIDATTGDILLGSHGAPPADHGTLSDREYAVAVDIARQQADKWATSITSASATVDTGTLTSNLHHSCTSGTLLHIMLIGTFHGIITSGGPPVIGAGTPDPSDGVVSAILLTADPESGFACSVSVHTGDATPDPGATILFTH